MAQKSPIKAADSLYRKKKLPEYQSFRLSRRIAPEKIKKIPTIRELWRDTWQFLWRFRVKMLIFSAVYLLAYVVLVKGVNGFELDIIGLRDGIKDFSEGFNGFILSLLAV